MNNRLRSLLAKKKALIEKASAISDAAEQEDRDLTDDEVTDQDEVLAELKTVNAGINREEDIAREIMKNPAVEIPGDLEIEGGAPRILDDPRRGFESYGDFVAAVYQAAISPYDLDERLRIGAAAPTTFGSESAGADGGFLVPPEFSSDIFTLSLEQDALLPLTDNMPVSGNGMTFPKDETTPWGTTGVQARWKAEGTAATADKPVIGTTTMRLHELICLVPMTQELLDDAPAAGSYIQGLTARAIRWKSNDAFVNGSGAGRPEGILNAAALVSVAKETAQVADTLVVANVAKMFARMIAGSLANARWLINNDVLPELITMVLSNQPIFTAPGALPDSPAGRLLGRPIMVTQHCQTIGDKGDIYFVDWSMYRTITKRGGIETATSMHLYFDANATAFRAVFRIDGQPKIASSIGPADGSNNLSPFVTLDERA